MMAAVAKYRNDLSGMINTGGSSTAYTVASAQGYTSLTDGITVTARMHTTSGATPTLNVDALGAKSIRVYTSTAVPTGAMLGGSIQSFTYDSGDDVWYVHSYRADPTPEIASTTAMLFVQTNAPTGWTKQTTHNNKALRLVTGTASSGGSTAFTSVFTSRTPTGTVGGTTLTVNQIPLHGHEFRWSNTTGGSNGSGGFMLDNSDVRTNSTFTGTPTDTAGQQIGGTGGGQSHDHSFTGGAMNFDVFYVDVIIATRD